MKQIKKTDIYSLKVADLKKTYGEIKAVNGVSFDAHIGEVITLLGPNGAGKSTLMNIMAGYLAATSGDVFINGKSVAESDLQTKKDVGFLPEGSPLYGDMTVRMFLKYFIELKLNLCESEVLSNRQIQQTYRDEFERIVSVAKIENVLPQKIETLSKGYARRVGFAVSLIGDPPILLLDEPTDGLDPNQKEHMRALIKNMSTNKTILISTHLLDEAETISSRIILMNLGKIVANGSLKEILSQTKKKTLADAFKILTCGDLADE